MISEGFLKIGTVHLLNRASSLGLSLIMHFFFFFSDESVLGGLSNIDWIDFSLICAFTDLILYFD